MICDLFVTDYLWKVRWFEAGKVGKKKPVPTGDHDIFCLNVAMTHLSKN